MTLTDEEKYIIKFSFAQLTNEGANFAECFYKNLFAMAPLIRPLFKSEHEILEKHFYELISTAVNKVDHFEDLRCHLLSLGRRHKAYGAQLIHFEVVKTALILSLQYELKDRCNEATKIAWSKYIDNISEVMIEGLLAGQTGYK